MGMKNQARDMALVTQAIHAVFVYAACTEAGFVKVGISRTPFERIYNIHCNSPSPVRAAQWAWVGGLAKAREIERKVAKEWAHRHTRGEWFHFDYADPADKQDFHDTLSAVVEVVTGRPPEWKRLGPTEVLELITTGNQIAAGKRPRP